MTATYDTVKAKALFSEHIKPVYRRGDGAYGQTRPKEDPTHYVITPEMLAAFRSAVYAASNRPAAATAIATVEYALWDHIDGLESSLSSPTPAIGWFEVIKPDPKPAWRVAADRALDEGLEFSAVLDAIQVALEEK